MPWNYVQTLATSTLQHPFPTDTQGRVQATLCPALPHPNVLSRFYTGLPKAHVRTRLSPPFRNGYSQSIRVRISDLRLSGRARPLLLRLQRDVNQFCQVDRASAGSLSDLFLTAESVGHNQGLRRSRPHGRKQHALRNRL